MHTPTMALASWHRILYDASTLPSNGTGKSCGQSESWASMSFLCWRHHFDKLEVLREVSCMVLVIWIAMLNALYGQIRIPSRASRLIYTIEGDDSQTL